MRKPEQSPEPSIEEILASIRRIIADDGMQARSAAINAGFPQAASDTQLAERSFERHPRRERLRPSVTEAAGSSDTQGDEEILELTEDFMLVEQPSEGAAPDIIADPSLQGPVNSEASDQAHATREGVDERGLHTVLSNVAAEVDRLASTDRSAGKNVASLAGEGDRKPVAGFQSQSPSARSSPPPVEPAYDVGARGGSADRASAIGLATPQPRPTPPRTHSRPVWSARRLEGDGATQPPPPRTEDSDSQSSETRSEVSGRQRGLTGRDHWAEGVQMPVPKSGPAMPFPYASEKIAKNAAAEPVLKSDKAASEEECGEIDMEKRFVGDFLTRVFSNSPQRSEESPVDDASPESKAEKLAKTAVTDFASDKLHAPAVAEALHADRPFMEKITDSLESALAEAENAEEGMLKNETAGADTAAQDELPEFPPPPDSEFLPFSGSAQEGLEPPVTERETQQSQAGPTVAEPRDDSFGDPGLSPDHAAKTAAIEQADSPQPHPVNEPEGREYAAVDSRDASQPESFQDALQLPIEEEPPQQGLAMGHGSLPANLEDSIKEMIKPLIIQWLNENLARIVEKAVREELAERTPLLSELRMKSGSR